MNSRFGIDTTPFQVPDAFTLPALPNLNARSLIESRQYCLFKAILRSLILDSSFSSEHLSIAGVLISK